jgi:hypothetical protein
MKHKNFGASAFLLMLSLCFTPTLADTSTRALSAGTTTCKALLVGMDYGSSSANWTSNATAMKTALLTWDCWQKGTIRLITGKATSKDIAGNLSAMNINANDLFIFYYSGHANRYLGYERSPALDNADEALYPTTSPKCFTDNNLTASLNQSSANPPDNYPNVDKIAVLDCCYSGGFWNGSDLGGGGDLETIHRIALLASTNETAQSPASSEFTNYLVQGMTKNKATGRAPADNNPADGIVTAKEWFDYAASRVGRAPIYGYRKQTEPEPLDNDTTLSAKTWTYNNPQAVDTNGTLDSMVSFPAGTVGGIAIPVDKLGLLAPYIGLASTIIAATVASAIYVKRVKRKKQKQ